MDMLKTIIQRKTLVSMLFIGITLLGYISYNKLPVELFPNAELPGMMVQVVSRTQVTPEYMENQAVIPIEGAISTLKGIEEIESTINSNRSTIRITYVSGTDIKYAQLRLDQKINEVKADLPEEFEVNTGSFNLGNLNSQFMNLKVIGEGGVDRVRNITDQYIQNKLADVDGVSEVQVRGGRNKAIEIILNKKVCEAQNITISDIRNVLSSNASTTTFVGSTQDGNTRKFVNLKAELDDITDIQNLIVRKEGPVLLRDVSQVIFGVKKETSYSRLNSKDIITINLLKDNQVNIIDLSHRMLETIESLNEELKPRGVSIEVGFNQAEIMENNINQIIDLAVYGGLLAVFVLWAFFRKVKLVFTLALAIPISVLAAFNLFYAYDININSLTLIGVALAIGMLLDNSVVVIENIYRLAATGKSPDEAVIQGTKEVARSVFASTLTTITVFLPFVFTDVFFIRLLGSHVGVSIISTLIISLVAALVLVPMVTHYVLKRTARENIYQATNLSIHNRLVQVYFIILKTSLRNPLKTIIGGAVCLFVTCLICFALSATNQLSEVEEKDLTYYIAMPIGSTLELTDQLVKVLEDKLTLVEEMESVQSQVEEDRARVTVVLKEEFESIDENSFLDVKERLTNFTKLFPDVQISLNEEEAASGGVFGGGGGGGGLSGGAGFMRFLGIGSNQEYISIKGEDFQQMKKIGNQLIDNLNELSSVRFSRMNVRDNQPEAQIVFDEKLMHDYEINLANVATELRNFSPQVSTGINFKQELEEYEITIVEDEEIEDEEIEYEPKDLQDLKMVQVKSASGESHDLEEFSRIRLARGTSDIRRINQEKEIKITYAFLREVRDSEDLLEVAHLEIDNLLTSINIPSGVTVEAVPEDLGLDTFYFLITAAIIIIFMILASVFESFHLPFVIMFSIPMAATGAFLGLIFASKSLLDPNTLIGFLILLGVVVNNGIILIDYSRILRNRGFNKFRALMVAGMSRIRPIFITVITTVVALIPLAMGQAEYVSIIGVSFAITVMGGLIFSTILTLVFIPTLSSGMETALNWFAGLKPTIKALQIVAMAIAMYLIYDYVDSLLWQIFLFFVVLIAVPGLTWFLMNSLRQAGTTLIGADEEITISIQNLVKVYERKSLIKRQWDSAKSIYDKSNEKLQAQQGKWNMLIWIVPVLGFLVYFIYFFLDILFWQFIFSHFLYLTIVYTFTSFSSLFRGSRKYATIRSLFLWCFVLLSFLYFVMNAETRSPVIIIGIIWMVGLVLHQSGKRLKMKPEVLKNEKKGFFRKAARKYYGVINVMPLIGASKKPFRALQTVNLTIGNGMFGLLGPNGAGKTTLMRIICGILDQSYGKIWINGIDTLEKREELQGLIGYLPQAFGTYENMTPYDFLQYQAIQKGITDKGKRDEAVQNVLKQVHMETHQDKPIGSFSGGMKQRIGIAQTLLHLPRILVVDEPTAGLDPLERIRFRNLLVELSKDRVVIFSTHIIEDIANSCSHVGVLINGKIQYDGTPTEMALIAKDKVWEITINPEDFEEIQRSYQVVHHMREGDQIKVKCLARDRPMDSAVRTTATLEDSYLWLLKDKNGIAEKEIENAN
ncbi:MAG: efflux RND transporter permease subunit [Cyclobacteriaceae bacterium]